MSRKQLMGIAVWAGMTTVVGTPWALAGEARKPVANAAAAQASVALAQLLREYESFDRAENPIRSSFEAMSPRCPGCRVFHLLMIRGAKPRWKVFRPA